jgi:(p)ppGpp synthase/HD superfamily hydrolase
MSLSFEAMMFAREVHKDQRRKYTNNPYVNHLAEVAGIVATTFSVSYHVSATNKGLEQYSEEIAAVAWLHDCMEDQGVDIDTLRYNFGQTIASGVWWLSDLEEGNRASRKALARERLANATDYIQTIKCADLISNTSSIVAHDPDFAVVYLKEKKLLLDVLTKADLRLLKLARSLL